MGRRISAVPMLFGLCVMWPASGGGEPKWLDEANLYAFYGDGFKIEHDSGWSLTSKSDGSMAFAKGDYFDRGKWRLDGDRVCSRWQKIRDRVEACFRVSVEGDSYTWERADGSQDTAKITSRGE